MARCNIQQFFLPKPSMAISWVTPNMQSFSFWSICSLKPTYSALYGTGFKLRAPWNKTELMRLHIESIQQYSLCIFMINNVLWHIPGNKPGDMVHASVPMSYILEPLMHELLVQQGSPSSFYVCNMVQSVHTNESKLTNNSNLDTRWSH